MHKSRLGVCQWRSRRGGRMMMALVAALLIVGMLSPTAAMAAPGQSQAGQEEWVRVYTVGSGDSLNAIALEFGVSPEAILRANDLRDPNQIYVGQKLIIPEVGNPYQDRPSSGNPGTGGPECADYRVVGRGESLSGIAYEYGLSAYALAAANGIYDLNEIYVGQRLCVPSQGENKPQPPVKEPERPAYQPEEPVYHEPAKEPERPAYRPEEPARGPYNGPGPDQGPNKPAEPWREPQGPERRPERGPDDRPNYGPQEPQLQVNEYWKGSYFKDKYFSEFVMERKDLEVNFNWLTGSPFGDSNEDRFSVRWEKVEAFRGGKYRFYAIADDGVRVYVDDQLLIDGWKIQPATEYKADIQLSEGPHKLVVEYYEEAEDAQVKVYWEPVRPQEWR